MGRSLGHRGGKRKTLGHPGEALKPAKFVVMTLHR
jgi:hypothetical protein